MNKRKRIIRHGWQCPICKHVYSPTVKMCRCCGDNSSNNTKSEFITEERLKYILKDYSDLLTKKLNNAFKQFHKFLLGV